MDNKEIESLANYLCAHFGLDNRVHMMREKLQEWQTLQTLSELLTFEVVAFYDKGFGPECMNLPAVKANTVAEAQKAAEEVATRTFMEKFGIKVEWEEVKIRPVK
jgi:hypothetical protein